MARPPKAPTRHVTPPAPASTKSRGSAKSGLKPEAVKSAEIPDEPAPVAPRKPGLGPLARLARVLDLPRDEAQDADQYLAAMLDLRTSVEVAHLLTQTDPKADAAKAGKLKVKEAFLDGSQAGHHGRDLFPIERIPPTGPELLASLDAVRRASVAIRIDQLPRTPPPTPMWVLGTLRGAGVFESGLSTTAAHVLIGPFLDALVRWIARAEQEVDLLVGEIQALATTDVQKRVVALDAELSRVIETKSAELAARVPAHLEARFERALRGPLEHLSEETTQRDAELASWVAPGGLLDSHLRLSERALRAIVEFRVTRAEALVREMARQVLSAPSTPAATSLKSG